MKIKLLTLKIIFFIFCFSSCETKITENLEKQRYILKNAKNINGYELAIIEFDSCEYIISGIGYTQMITHKGNCKYCKKRQIFKYKKNKI